MNPLQKARSGLSTAWSGTTRTTRWARDGVAKPFRHEGGGSDGRGLAGRIAAAAPVESARSHGRVAIAWAVGGLLVAAWIGWTIYAWSENGSAAGLGVLITWPAVLLALAVIASPFVGLWWMLRERETDAVETPDRGEPHADAKDVAADEAEGGAEDETDDEAEKTGNEGEASEASEGSEEPDSAA